MDEAKLFFVTCSNRTSCCGLKLEHRRFCTTIQKNFTVRVMEHWNMISERFWSLLLWRYSSPVWMPTCANCCKVPVLAGGLESMVSKGHFQPL